MFVLHESTQRWLCRIAFLACCLIPTLYVVSWAAAVNTPQYERGRRQAWQARLEAGLGMRVQIAGVSQPDRDVTLLEGVSLTPPESEIPIARARVIEIRPYQNGYVAMASQLEVDANRIAQLWELLHDRLLVRGDENCPVVWLRCSELTLAGDDREQTVVDVSAKWNALAPQGPTVLAEFQLPERSSKPVQLAVRRDRQPHYASTLVDLQTHDAALPCSVLGDAFTLVKAFGPRAEFRGRLQLVRGSDGAYSGSISEADLLKIETQPVLALCSLHTLRTIANVRLESVEFEAGRLRSISGGVAAEFGVVDASFLRSLNEHLKIATPEEVLDERQREKLNFQRLAIDFALNDQDGLFLQGACEDGFQGAMIVGDSGPLLQQPQRNGQTAVALIRALVPANDLQTPATRQTRQLVNVLPTPDLQRATPQRPSATLQLRNQ